MKRVLIVVSLVMAADLARRKPTQGVWRDVGGRGRHTVSGAGRFSTAVHDL